MIRLAKYLKPYLGSVILTLFLLFLQTISNLFLPALMAKIVDIGIPTGNTSYIIYVGLFMLLVALLGSAFMVFANLNSAKIAMGFSRDLRKDLFMKVESFSLGEFNTLGTSSLITRTTNDITQVQQLVLMSLRMMVTAPLMVIGGLIMALSTNLELSIVLVISIPILILVIGLVAKFGMPLFKSMQVKLDKLNLVLRENLTGIRVVRAFNKVPYEQKRFDGANADLTSTAVRVNKIMAVLMPSMMIIMNLTSVAIIWFGAIRIEAGGLEVGSLIAFIQYVMQIMMALVMVTMMFVMIPRAAASAERINEVLDTPLEIKDLVKETVAPSLCGQVAFNDVTFYYPNSEEPALNHISFETKPGKITAIIGGTGSGKSTLVNLIPRFYEVSTGELLVDGVDVKSMTQAELRSKIGLIPQKALLFSGTIRDNLKYGKEDATDEEIWEALKTAQAYDFVSNMDDGLDSYIAQGGTNVSGGQKQRLCIARALIRKPEVYIFDDSFSALDFKTDSNLRKALKSEITESAMILVAQRISTIMDADEILVLYDGNVVGQGTHRELLDNCEVYKEIALSQLSKEEIENGK
ncbi:MAG: ABC transporter ATP-binding protein [Niameybacter sp.]|uniref:ABC transporter ATP-binding protein n=1 Tax=Niameybacter sp. TaxID=2033640 RepID=UPI002FCA564A